MPVSFDCLLRLFRYGVYFLRNLSIHVYPKGYRQASLPDVIIVVSPGPYR